MSAVDTRVLDLDGLPALLAALAHGGRTVLGPVVSDGVLRHRPLAGADDLPAAVGDEQAPGTYRLTTRDDQRVFGFAAPVDSWKPTFLPAREPVGAGGVEDVDGWSDLPAPAPVALVGVRSCDLAAIAVQDAVLRDRQPQDVRYATRRADVLVVAVTCSDPAGTCFCASMGTGPRADAGFDLRLTEVLEPEHAFLVAVGSAAGEEVLARVPTREATDEDRSAADRVTAGAAARMGRSMDTADLRDLLYDAAESRRWDDIAQRCLACGNCTMACPTCFCTTVEDVQDLAGDPVRRWRLWDSCFTSQLSYLHGGSVRSSVPARYRQWLTHKLAAWQDQFGTSGCVGCGRCITWCPVGIDLTEEVATLRALAAHQASAAGAGAGAGGGTP
ncbi:MAG: 4Fe-4S dicluster domain-containing protein [Candidatus Nanopelagicales bacterium]